MVRKMQNGDLNQCKVVERKRFDTGDCWPDDTWIDYLTTGLCFVVGDENEIFGYVVATEDEPNQLHIRNLAVVADGHGWGRELLLHVHSFGKTLELQVKRTNSNAVRFYEKNGFHLIGETPGYFYYELTM